MREIKFRAWNQEYEAMHYQCEVDEFFWFDVDVTNLSLVYNEQYFETGSGYAEEQWRQVEQVTAVFMQYTGLKDKNGKEIYEGDILATDFAGNTINGVMEYKVTKTGAGWASFLPLDQYEVIGNIYESPELLEDEK